MRKKPIPPEWEKITELLEKDESAAIGVQMLRQLPFQVVWTILKYTRFKSDIPSTGDAQKTYRFLVLNSLFSLNLEDICGGTFNGRCITMRGIFDQFETWDSIRMPDKEPSLSWIVYNYDRAFCEKLGIKKLSQIT